MKPDFKNGNGFAPFSLAPKNNKTKNILVPMERSAVISAISLDINNRAVPFSGLVQWNPLFKAWFPKSTVTLFTYYSVDVLRCNPNCKIHSRKHLLIMVLLKSKLGWSKKQSKTKNEKRYSSKWRWCLIGWVTNSSLSIQFSWHRIIFHTSGDLSKVCLLLRYWNVVPCGPSMMDYPNSGRFLDFFY